MTPEEIQNKLLAGDIRGALESLETFELESAAADHVQVQFYGVQLICHLILNDLNNARFLWKRIPTEFKKSNTSEAVELNAIWKIGKMMWRREYAEVYKSLNSHPWSPSHSALIGVLQDGFRRRTFELLATAYSNISEADCAAALGLGIPETITLLTNQGWKHETGYFLPKKPEKQKQRVTSQQQLQQLTEYILFLEQAM